MSSYSGGSSSSLTRKLAALSNDLMELRDERRLRYAARSRLVGFTDFTFPAYRAAPHHKLIAEKLEEVASGVLDRLMIFVPPRHGKSQLASIQFPAWYLGQHPTKEIIAASYMSDIVEDFDFDFDDDDGSDDDPDPGEELPLPTPLHEVSAVGKDAA